MFETPVALFIYHRPSLTAQVVDALRTVKPTRLFVVADGPHPSRANDPDLCAATRAVIETVDWECTILKNYAPSNLGAGRRVSSGLAWVFDQVDEVIILEDDCLPDPTFFPFCAQLLATYRDDDRVMMISGYNPLERWRAEVQSYHFSRYGIHWGWATWQRAWRHYDFEMLALARPDTAVHLLAVMQDPACLAFYQEMWAKTASGQFDAWDFQWALMQLLQDGLSVVPAVNLVSNIGFGPAATHTRRPLTLSLPLARHAMTFPLVAPAQVEADREYDDECMAWRMGHPSVNLVLSQARQSLAANHNVYALLLAEAALRSSRALTNDERASLSALKTRALAALKQNRE